MTRNAGGCGAATHRLRASAHGPATMQRPALNGFALRVPVRCSRARCRVWKLHHGAFRVPTQHLPLFMVLHNSTVALFTAFYGVGKLRFGVNRPRASRRGQ